MKKGIKHTEMSDKRCIICNKPLKKRVVKISTNADKCYICSRVEKGIKKRDVVKTKTGMQSIKTIDYEKKQKENLIKYKN